MNEPTSEPRQPQADLREFFDELHRVGEAGRFISQAMAPRNRELVDLQQPTEQAPSVDI